MASLLLQQSPTTAATVYDLFGDRLHDFEQAFELAAKLGGCREFPVHRPAGASFNPRPCRIVQIMLRELRIRHPESLIAAMLTCSYDVEALRQISPSNPLYPAAQCACGVIEGSNDDNAVSIRLCLMLDEIRHLHMTYLSEAERRAKAAEISTAVLPFLKPRLASSPLAGGTERGSALQNLAVKINQAVERFLRSRIEVMRAS